MKTKFRTKRLRSEALGIIKVANGIIVEYQAQGFSLTLRQLYYQFVARGLIPNTDRDYKKLGTIISNGRLAGLVDWDAIEDRTRFVRRTSTWDSPKQIIEVCTQQYRVDMWENQPHRLEVWIEKDALIGVIEDVCNEFQVPYFSCRGYVSQSETYAAGQRMAAHSNNEQKPIILHLGDHDPSGIDMTRDIECRVNLFSGHEEAAKEFEEEFGYPIEEHEDYTGYSHKSGYEVEVKRLALNIDQVKEFNPPPNPTKLTDTRCGPYLKKYGSKSWELDALEPSYISKLIKTNIEQLIDFDEWEKRSVLERKHIKKLTSICKGLK